MIIKKKYHFYAAHRNEGLVDKCRNIHGHTYYVEVDLEFEETKNGVCFYQGHEMLFSKIDSIIDPIIKKFDHGMFINSSDPLLPYLAKYIDDTGDKLNLNVSPTYTSAENIAQSLFYQIQRKLPISQISLQETTSSIIIYNGE